MFFLVLCLFGFKWFLEHYNDLTSSAAERAAADARSAEAMATRAFSRISDDWGLISLTGPALSLLIDGWISLVLETCVLLIVLGAGRYWGSCLISAGTIECSPVEGEELKETCFAGAREGSAAPPLMCLDPPYIQWQKGQF